MKTSDIDIPLQPAKRRAIKVSAAILAGMLWLDAGHRLHAQPVIPPSQPTNYTACAGGTATFCVEAQGTPPVTYQWRVYTNTLNFTNVVDATNACLTLTDLPATGFPPRPQVVVSDASGGSVTSRVAGLTIRTVPSITQQPRGASVSLGGSVVFSVAATTTSPPLSYQWQFHGTNLPGQTQNSLTLQISSVAQAGNYTVVVSNACGTVVSDPALIEVDLTFTKITQGPPATDQEGSIPATWIDYDQDGFLDLFVGNSRRSGITNSLYHNEGNGSFTKITTNLLGSVSGNTWGIAWGDYDNDGKVDLFVVNEFNRVPSVFHNEGGGAFTRVTNGVLVETALDGNSAVWGDYDNDGLIDLFVGTGYWGGPQNDRLFHNEGNGAFRITTFAEVGAAVNDNAQGYVCAWNDYDNDGDLDLFVIYLAPPFNGPASNFVFRNLGNGPFEKIALPDFDVARQGGGASWGDYDNDGYADAFLPSFAYTNALFKNLQGQGFTNMAATAGLAVAMAANGSAWGDYDNDGWLDLIVGSYEGEPNYTGGQNLFHNNQDGTFTRISTGSLPRDGGRTTAAAWGDYDNDGFLDLYVACGDGTPQRNPFYRNNTNSNQWLKVKLDGLVSNRLGIGAKIRVLATIGGRRFWQLRTITGQHSWVGDNGLLAHFGLGDATNVETLRVEWPSGQVTELNNVAVRQFLTITEAPGLRAIGLVQGAMQMQITAHPGMNIELRVTNNLPINFTTVPYTNWPLWQTVLQTNRTMMVTDPEAGQHPRRFYGARAK